MKDDTLPRIFLDRNLASFGDVLVNLIYSLAVTRRKGVPAGVKVSNRVLAEAMRRAGLRAFLPGKIDRRFIGNSAEALIAYAWLGNRISLDECVEVVGKKFENPEDALKDLLLTILEKLVEK